MEDGSGSAYEIKTSFHSRAYADGELCPGQCSFHGDCSQGRCDCVHDWGGVDCSFGVLPVSLDRTYHFSLEASGTTLAYFDGNSGELDVNLYGGMNLTVCVLESDSGEYSIPSKDYYTYSHPLSMNAAKVTLKASASRPMYLSLIGTENDSVAMLLSVSGSGSSAPDSTLILIGVLIPSSLVLLSGVGIISCIRMWRKREQRRVRVAARRSSVQPKSTKPDLDVVSSLLVYGTITVHYSTDCAVCLDAFQPETEVRLLACGHAYHSGCLENLAERQQTCCVCKQDFERKCDVSILTTQGDVREVGA